MTGRVCPVHGEYAANGICRWCELALPRVDVETRTNPARPGSQFVRDLHDHEAQDWTNYDPRYCHVCEVEPRESAVAKAVRQYFATRDGMRPLFSTRQRYSTPEGIASHNAFWEAKLAEQHAALRWERVARRWATKAKFDGHVKTVDGTLLFDPRCASCLRLAGEGRWP